jgi:hypothetical protein
MKARSPSHVVPYRRIWPLFIFLLAGCLPQVIRPQPPQVALADLQIASLSLPSGEVTLRFDLQMTNPNPYPLPLLPSLLKVKIGGADFPIQVSGATLEPHQPTLVPAQLNFSLGQGLGAATELLSLQPVPLTVEGVFYFSLGSARWSIGPLLLAQKVLQLRLFPPGLSISN